MTPEAHAQGLRNHVLDAETETALIEELIRIDRSQEPLDGPGAIICHANNSRRYLSGALYLWTGFRERAFVFKNAQQAQEVIDTYSLPATVHVRA